MNLNILAKDLNTSSTTEEKHSLTLCVSGQVGFHSLSLCVFVG